MTASLGYIGLGIMGLSMTKNLLKAGNTVHAWNRSPHRLDEAVKAGAMRAENPAAIRGAADVVFVCVTNDAALREVLIESPTALVKGDGRKTRIVVDMSTVAPSTETRIAAELAGHGIAYIDAPVTGGDVGAANGTLTVMGGGDEKAFREVKPFFRAVGKNIVYTGPQGSGQLTKCVNQILVAINVAAMSEALVFAQRAPIDMEKTLDSVSKGAAGSWALSNYGPRVLKGDLKPGFRAQDMLKDLRIVLNEARALGISLPVTALAEELFEKLCETHTEVGNHGLIKIYSPEK